MIVKGVLTDNDKVLHVTTNRQLKEDGEKRLLKKDGIKDLRGIRYTPHTFVGITKN